MNFSPSHCLLYNKYMKFYYYRTCIKRYTKIEIPRLMLHISRAAPNRLSLDSHSNLSWKNCNTFTKVFMIMTVSIPWPLVKFNFQLAVDLQIHREPLTLVRGARECYHLPKVNSQTSGGKEASYFSILDWLQAESNRFPKPNCSLYKNVLKVS